MKRRRAARQAEFFAARRGIVAACPWNSLGSARTFGAPPKITLISGAGAAVTGERHFCFPEGSEGHQFRSRRTFPRDTRATPRTRDETMARGTLINVETNSPRIDGTINPLTKEVSDVLLSIHRFYISYFRNLIQKTRYKFLFYYL